MEINLIIFKDEVISLENILCIRKAKSDENTYLIILYYNGYTQQYRNTFEYESEQERDKDFERLKAEIKMRFIK